MVSRTPTLFASVSSRLPSHEVERSALERVVAALKKEVMFQTLSAKQHDNMSYATIAETSRARAEVIENVALPLVRRMIDEIPGAARPPEMSRPPAMDD